ncbi:DNA damage-inducible protein 1 [Savitreella phatthalungensis]
MLAQLRAQQPALAEAAVNDPPRFAQMLRDMARQQYEDQAERDRQYRALEDDPFDVEAQRRIEEIIRQEAVLDNLNNAMEYHPESFGRVTMLYVDVEVNGHKVKAFVDSGAQATIMSPDCAERCNLTRLIDKRFAGIAHGVGTANILGRVHSAQVKVGSMFILCSFTIMEGRTGPEMLLGLDMLRRHQANIDLGANKLRIGNEAVRFLDEHEIPAEAKDVEAKAKMSAVPSNPSQLDRQAPLTSQPASTGPMASSQPSVRGAASTEKVQQLISMGFDHAECVHALEATRDDVELAAGILLGN